MKLAPFAIALAGAFGLTACHDDHSYSGHRHYGYYGHSRPSTAVVVTTGPRYGYGYDRGYGYNHGPTYRRNTTVVNNNTVVRNTTVKRNNNVVVVNKKKKKNHDHD